MIKTFALFALGAALLVGATPSFALRANKTETSTPREFRP